ncbi:MAG: hypothetical protein AAF730_07940 [Bacteroidota bacterium]
MTPSYPLLALLFLLCPALALAQSGEVSYPDGFDEPFPHFAEALGTQSYPISSTVDSAQVFFDQGFQMMYAFTKEDAARSFREAQRRDPDCAICHWGEAWAWGPYLNGKMRDAEAPRAYAALQQALALRGNASDKERALIDAMQVRYVADGYTRDNQAPRDTAYADALRDVYERYPDDLDIGTLYAESLFLLEPRRGTRDVNDPDIQQLHGVLEDILDRDIRHTGACHLYIHATESSQDPGLAEPCAEYIGSSIPGASHINHMPSHTWNEIGRWADAVRANVQAWHSDQKAAIGEGFAIYPSHNLHMLLFAASMDGQGGVASQAGRDYHKLTGNSMYTVLTLVRFGRFDEVLQVEDRPTRSVPAGLWDFAQGYARLKTGEPEFAEAYLQKVLTAADTSGARFRFHPANLLLGTAGGILEGEIAWQAGDHAAAETAFRRAVALEDSLTYDEPEPLPFAARHWLGALLLEQERYAEAEQVYRDELDDRPNNGWSLFGLHEALTAQGRPDPEVEAAFDASWARSDTWIRGSRF